MCGVFYTSIGKVEMSQEVVRVDGIKWWIITPAKGAREVTPLCPEHDLRLSSHPVGQVYEYGRYRSRIDSEALELECAEGPHTITIPREFAKEKKYVIDRIDALIFKGMKTVDLDGALTPIGKEKLTSKNGKYFVTTQLMESKRGIQVVVYAGEKGRKEKTQIFIEPEMKRLAFDQKDLNPTEVFTKLKATFDDGSSHEIQQKAK